MATLAVYLNALNGQGVHVVTVNDYLARRDAEWMGQIYRFLGLTVGCVYHDWIRPDVKPLMLQMSLMAQTMSSALITCGTTCAIDWKTWCNGRLLLQSLMKSTAF